MDAVLIGFLIGGALTYWVWKDAHRLELPSAGTWTKAAALVGVFAVVPYLFARRSATRRKVVAKRCPDCAELVHADALVCKHCGYRPGHIDVVSARSVAPPKV